jgi:structure-specific endonuclease subunit SLX1
MSSWCVYLLVSLDGRRTYVGASNDPDRRLKQHNGEKSGGARSTAGVAWRRAALVSGFCDKIEALQFEWRWKHLTEKFKQEKEAAGTTPIERRMEALHRLFVLFPRADELEYKESFQ